MSVFSLFLFLSFSSRESLVSRVLSVFYVRIGWCMLGMCSACASAMCLFFVKAALEGHGLCGSFFNAQMACMQQHHAQCACAHAYTMIEDSDKVRTQYAGCLFSCVRISCCVLCIEKTVSANIQAHTCDCKSHTHVHLISLSYTVHTHAYMHTVKHTHTVVCMCGCVGV
eukprot:GDKI01042668.1.p1 GENE.GDKI01042668.1~~GDKI01042668.1.p1  ORF type:complete len:169 (+),score=30.90 GDKI01042668.1:522-1028(+)